MDNLNDGSALTNLIKELRQDLDDVKALVGAHVTTLASLERDMQNWDSTARGERDQLKNDLQQALGIAQQGLAKAEAAQTSANAADNKAAAAQISANAADNKAAAAQISANAAENKAAAAQKTANAALPRSGGKVTGVIEVTRGALHMGNGTHIHFFNKDNSDSAWIGFHPNTTSLHIGGLGHPGGYRQVFLAAQVLTRWNDVGTRVEF